MTGFKPLRNIKHDSVVEQYERWNYPKPVTDLAAKDGTGIRDAGDPSLMHYAYWPTREYWEGMDILVAGCGTNEAARYAYHNPTARVVGIDVSASRLRHEEFLKERYGLTNLSLYHIAIEEISELKLNFDLVAANGVIHHLADPAAGLTALKQVPEALQVLEFADGRASLIAVRAFAGGPLVTHPVKELRRHLPNVDARIVAIFRNDASVRVDGDTQVQPGDEVFFLAASQNIRTVMSELRRMDKPVRRVMMAGGGNIGLRVARSLDTGAGLDTPEKFVVKIIESNKKRAEVLAQQLSSHILVLNGDATDEDLLLQEGVHYTDLFLALTNDDENNIMSSLLAKRLGARRVIALINRKSYGDLMQGGQIDIAVSPSYATLSALLRFVRRGDVVAAHSCAGERPRPSRSSHTAMRAPRA